MMHLVQGLCCATDGKVDSNLRLTATAGTIDPARKIVMALVGGCSSSV